MILGWGCLTGLLAALGAGCGGDPPVVEDVGRPELPVLVQDVVADTSGGPDGDGFVKFDTVAPPEVGPAPGECTGAVKGAECGCDFNADCFSGWCIPIDTGPFASVCTQVCGGPVTCPEGWSCTPVVGPGDQVSICVPPVVVLCQECSENLDCGGPADLCLDLSDGRQCGLDCGPGTEPCPAAYECKDVPGPGGGTAKQCVPKSGACTCDETVDFQTDPINCGKCKRSCEFPDAIAGCEGGVCTIDGCHEGFADLDEVLDNGCEYACTKTSDIDLPDAAGIDSNCDGIDGDAARGVFVAQYGKASGLGTRNSPVQTIAQGLAKAVAGDKELLFVASGEYREQVVAVDGVSIYGGYSPDGLWERDPASFETIIVAETPDATGQIRTLVMDGMTKTTVLGGLTINAGSNTLESASSYAVWIRNSGDAVRIVGCRVIGGNGGPGKSGAAGTKGSPGAQGQPGTEGRADCSCNEEITFQGKGGVGGVATCPGDAGRGGDGASALCGSASAPGGSASPDGTPGGAGQKKGDDGDDGAVAAHGPAGDGAGTVDAEGLWRGSPGGDGEAGKHGRGGGGGGASPGIPIGWFSLNCPIVGGATWGGGGGGGGSAGCGGLPGKRGTAGGGSFGVFSLNSSPLVQSTTVGHRSGGNGGNGGLRGAGGKGGNGGIGGTSPEGKLGGAGGRGGDGSAAGNGGGGGGGAAFGIYATGTGAPTCQSVIYEPLGTGGLGGFAGDGQGSNGGTGLRGGSNGLAGCPN
jgi:hypothetical protein